MTAPVANPIADIWVYLSATPLLGLTITLLVYQGAYRLYARAGFHPLLNPVGLAIIVALFRRKQTVSVDELNSMRL